MARMSPYKPFKRLLSEKSIEMFSKAIASDKSRRWADQYSGRWPTWLSVLIVEKTPRTLNWRIKNINVKGFAVNISKSKPITLDS